MDLNTIDLLKINGESLNLGQMLQYYQISGRLLPWVKELVEQHVIFKAIQQREDVSISFPELEQAALEFRVQQNLVNENQFKQWLAQQSISYDIFQRRVALSLQINKLKAAISAPNLPQAFESQKTLLDSVEFSCIAVSEESWAHNLREEINHHYDRFEQLMQEYATVDALKATANRQTLRCGQLPEELRERLSKAHPGEIIGPIEVEQRWAIFRLEHHHPAQLDQTVQQALENQLFQAWLAQELQQASVQFAATPAPMREDSQTETSHTETSNSEGSSSKVPELVAIH